jgi:thioredoxin reductase
VQQMTNFGAEFTLGEITAVDVIADCKMVSTAETTYTCKGIVIASGSLPKKLKVPGEQEFTHRGVFYCATKIEKIVGEDQVTAIEMEGCNTGEKSHLEVKGILVRIGLTPNTQFLSCMLPLTPVGQIPVDENMETSIPGIFAAGDVRRHSPMQIATAVGDGVHAAMSLGCYIETL